MIRALRADRASEIPGFRGQQSARATGGPSPTSKSSPARHVLSIYDFIKAESANDPVRTLCRLLEVAPSGYCAWLEKPLSDRAVEDARLVRLIRASFIASQGIYGAPRVFLEPREAGETCSRHRVARLMREQRLRAHHGYRTRRWSVGKPPVLIPHWLQRGFTVNRPNKAWVTDITHGRTWRGWLYLAVVMDLFSRKVVGWAAGPTIHRELVLDALRMAVRARRPRGTPIHTVAEAFFGSLQKELIKKQIHESRDLAKAAIADCIEAFCNRSRRHSHLGGVIPEQFDAVHR